MKAKYNMVMASLFRETFCWLPLAHLLNRRVLVLHGGLFSKDGVSLDDLRAIDRYRHGFCSHCHLHIASTWMQKPIMFLHERRPGHAGMSLPTAVFTICCSSCCIPAVGPPKPSTLMQALYLLAESQPVLDRCPSSLVWQEAPSVTPPCWVS